jgi:transcriptional regulator with XRE-family HTH domain
MPALNLVMARPSRLKLPRLPEASVEGEESLGVRLARFRKERGFTQVELAQRMGITQALITDYERDKLRPYAEMVVRFALALGLSTDEVLGVRVAAHAAVARIPRRFLRRLEALSQLPKRDQEALLRTIDAFLGLRTGSPNGRAA